MVRVRTQSLVLLVTLLASGAASAATFRYASSNNRIYIEGGGSAVTLSDVKTALPTAPLNKISDSPAIWVLNANLQITGGSALNLHGTPAGGDVDELRIQSNNDATGYVTITADYGVIDIDSTHIQSWDAAANGPDTNYSNGRAYIHVRSSYDTDGTTPLESRMNIADSEINHLGFNAAEAYGLVWKVNVPTIADYAKVNVWGDINSSRLHNNYYGVYTFGHQDGVFYNNEVDHNVGYGLDMHDDTDNLTVETNNVHDNGNHGIIFSKRCDHAVIHNNDVYNNTGNGIMVHRSSDDALIDDNRSTSNTDAGVAIFGSSRTEVSNNALFDNANAGVRISVGGTSNNVHDNEISGGSRGLYFYKGTDTPEPGDDGRPKSNTLKNNFVHDLTGDGIKMSDSDNNVFITNTFANVGTLFEFATSPGTTLNNNDIPAGVTVKASGNSAHHTSLTVRPNVGTALPIRINDAYSSFQFRNSARAIFDVAQNVFTSVTPTSSLMTLTQGTTSGATTVFSRNMFATPSSGMNVAINITQWASTRAWQAQATSASGTVQYVLGKLTPGAQYAVQQGGSSLGIFTADAAGNVSFTATPGTTSSVNYTVTKQ